MFNSFEHELKVNSSIQVKVFFIIIIIEPIKSTLPFGALVAMLLIDWISDPSICAGAVFSRKHFGWNLSEFSYTFPCSVVLKHLRETVTESSP